MLSSCCDLRQVFLSKVIYVLLFLVLTSILSCADFNRPDSFPDSASFMKYVDKNKSLKKDAILENGVTISAMFLPNTLVLKDVAEVEDYQNNLYLMLSFSKNGKELLSQIPSDEYSSMLHTFSFGMESIVSIKTAENEPVNPLTVVFQPTYKMGKSNDITIVFRRDEFLDAEAIRVSLKEFGLNAGLLDFTFNVPDINYIANINILNP